MHRAIAGTLVAVTLCAAAGGAIANAAASGGSAPSTSRLDDGAGLVAQAQISEQQAIAAAQTRATGPLNEVDLEHAGGRLVYNVDVGAHDVKVDAATGQVVSVDADD